jgi:site-specific recombinase XerD
MTETPDSLLKPETPGTAALAFIAEKAREYVRQAKAPNTRRAYRSDWEHFTAWCQARTLAALPAAPETVALYLSDLAAGFKASTLTRRVSAISQAHQMAGHESPTHAALVQQTMAGIRRSLGTAPTEKNPILTGDMRAMVAELPTGPLGVRDRALLLVGFAGALRRSELVGIDRDDIEFTTEGLVITLRRSKTDQEGAGRKVAIQYGAHPETCPVLALQAWLQASGVAAGSVFHPINRHGQMRPGRLSGTAVALIVKRYAAKAGLDPAQYAGHSLRAGLATSAAIAGASERAIMAQTGHRSLSMVRRYIRDGNLFRENVTGMLGL